VNSETITSLVVIDIFSVHTCRNPALEQQACDRVYRVGQKRNVFIHRFHDDYFIISLLASAVTNDTVVGHLNF